MNIKVYAGPDRAFKDDENLIIEVSGMTDRFVDSIAYCIHKDSVSKLLDALMEENNHPEDITFEDLLKRKFFDEKRSVQLETFFIINSIDYKITSSHFDSSKLN